MTAKLPEILTMYKTGFIEPRNKFTGRYIRPRIGMPESIELIELTSLWDSKVQIKIKNKFRVAEAYLSP